MYLIGIDVGGTNVKFGLFRNKVLIDTLIIPTNTFDIVRQLVNGARELVENNKSSLNDVSGFAVGFPGMVIDNVIKDSPNIGLVNCNMLEILSQEFGGKPVVVLNDAEIAAIAEYKLGAGNGCDNMILVTVGTGVGGGIIINKELYVGNGGAGELGHMVIEVNGAHCNCGRKGCAEQYISLTALDRMARELINSYPDSIVNITSKMVNASDLMSAYKRNDSFAKVVIDKYVGLFTEYILNLCNLFRPQRIVIGGGLCYAPEIISMIANSCQKASYGYANSPKVDIVPAVLGNEAGIKGVIVCFEDKINNEFELRQVDNNKEENNQVYNNNGFATNSDNHFQEAIDYTNIESTKDTNYNQSILDRLNEKLRNK